MSAASERVMSDELAALYAPLYAGPSPSVRY